MSSLVSRNLNALPMVNLRQLSTTSPAWFSARSASKSEHSRRDLQGQKRGVYRCLAQVSNTRLVCLYDDKNIVGLEKSRFERLSHTGCFKNPKADCKEALCVAFDRYEDRVWVGRLRSDPLNHPVVFLRDPLENLHFRCETTTTTKTYSATYTTILGCNKAAKYPWYVSTESGFLERKRILHGGAVESNERLLGRGARSSVLTQVSVLNFQSLPETSLGLKVWEEVLEECKSVSEDTSLKKSDIQEALLVAIDQNPDNVGSDPDVNESSLRSPVFGPDATTAPSTTDSDQRAATELAKNNNSTNQDLTLSDALYRAQTLSGFDSLPEGLKAHVVVGCGIFWENGSLFITEDGWQVIGDVGGNGLVSKFLDNKYLRKEWKKS